MTLIYLKFNFFIFFYKIVLKQNLDKQNYKYLTLFIKQLYYII